VPEIAESWTSDDACGPYVVESFEPCVQATLNKNPNNRNLDGFRCVERWWFA
jgi:hypothetical protein